MKLIRVPSGREMGGAICPCAVETKASASRINKRLIVNSIVTLELYSGAAFDGKNFVQALVLLLVAHMPGGGVE